MISLSELKKDPKNLLMTLSTEDGTFVAKAVMRYFPTMLRDGEYQASRTAKCLYRDVLYHLDLWKAFTNEC
jgi:hypothetical protein